MKELILLIISAAIVNNVVLSQFLGLCPFLGVSKKVETAGGMGAAVIFVITIASLVTSLIYKFILAPLDLTYLQTIVFILVIAALVQFVEMFLKKQPLFLLFYCLQTYQRNSCSNSRNYRRQSNRHILQESLPSRHSLPYGS